MVEYSYGGLLGNNVYVNNKKKKEESETFADGLINDPAYQQAKMLNARQMQPINNPSPENVLERVNAYSNVQDMEYPENVLQAPKTRNALMTHLFGNIGYQPSVEEKKLVYRMTKNLTDAEKVFLKANPEEFMDYINKVGDYAPSETTGGSGNDSTLMQNVKYVAGLRELRDNFDKGSPEYIKYSQMIQDLEAGLSSKKYDPNSKENLSNAGALGTSTYTYPVNETGKVDMTQDENGEYIYERKKVLVPKGFTDGTDKVFGSQYVDWLTKDYAEALENNTKMTELIADIESGANVSGVGFGLASEFFSDSLIAGFFPKGTNAYDEIKSIVYKSLKASLGAQFTEREAKNLVQASWNPALPPEINLKRLKRVMATAERRLRMKYSLGKHFEEFGSLYMYEGSTTLQDEYVKANDKSFNELLNNSFNIEDYFNANGKPDVKTIQKIYDNPNTTKAEKDFLSANFE